MVNLKCPDCDIVIPPSAQSCPKCWLKREFLKQTNDKPTDFIYLSTTNEIQGQIIDQYLGLVFGAGNATWTLETTSGRAGTALAKAEDQLREAAAELGADAVIGIEFSMDSSGNSINRSQAITLLGTAVKLK